MSCPVVRRQYVADPVQLEQIQNRIALLTLGIGYESYIRKFMAPDHSARFIIHTIDLGNLGEISLLIRTLIGSKGESAPCFTVVEVASLGASNFVLRVLLFFSFPPFPLVLPSPLSCFCVFSILPTCVPPRALLFFSLSSCFWSRLLLLHELTLFLIPTLSLSLFSSCFLLPLAVTLNSFPKWVEIIVTYLRLLSALHVTHSHVLFITVLRCLKQ